MFLKMALQTVVLELQWIDEVRTFHLNDACLSGSFIMIVDFIVSVLARAAFRARRKLRMAVRGVFSLLLLFYRPYTSLSIGGSSQLTVTVA